MTSQTMAPAAPAVDRATAMRSRRRLAARLEPFDSYWQAPADVDSGYAKFAAYYRANYLPHLPAERSSRILVVSCGPGYLVGLLRMPAIPTSSASIPIRRRSPMLDGARLPCETAEAFRSSSATASRSTS